MFVTAGMFVFGDMHGRLEKRDGEDYLFLHSMNMDTDIKTAQVKVDNLFNGDKLLGEATNRVLNENWKEIFVSYRGIIVETVGIVAKDLANKVLMKYPFKELYPD